MNVEHPIFGDGRAAETLVDNRPDSPTFALGKRPRMSALIQRLLQSSAGFSEGHKVISKTEPEMAELLDMYTLCAAVYADRILGKELRKQVLLIRRTQWQVFKTEIRRIIQGINKKLNEELIGKRLSQENYQEYISKEDEIYKLIEVIETTLSFKVK